MLAVPCVAVAMARDTHALQEATGQNFDPLYFGTLGKPGRSSGHSRERISE